MRILEKRKPRGQTEAISTNENTAKRMVHFFNAKVKVTHWIAAAFGWAML